MDAILTHADEYSPEENHDTIRKAAIRSERPEFSAQPRGTGPSERQSVSVRWRPAPLRYEAGLFVSRHGCRVRQPLSSAVHAPCPAIQGLDLIG